MKRRRRTAEEIDKLLADFQQSGKTKQAYSQEIGIGKSTLDRWMQQRRQGQRMIRVRVKAAPEQGRGFTLILNNGRRIESGWRFGDAELVRLVRIAEVA